MRSRGARYGRGVKVGIVGAGFVGAAAANALTLRGIATEIVLTDVNMDKARAEASDVAHVTPFSAPVRVTAGGIEDLAGSAAVVLTAGVAQKPGESRLDLLQRNAQIMGSIVPRVVEAAPDAVLVVATNPVDLITRVVERDAVERGVPRERVFGTGTMLDTARFRQIVAARVGVDVSHVHGYVVGEHGDSEVLLWSSVGVAGRPLAEFAAAVDIPFEERDRRAIQDEVVSSAYRIIEVKGATYYGAAAAISRLVDVVLRDRRAILTISAWSPEFDCAVSLPRLVGGGGILREVGVPMDEAERTRLQRSADLLCETLSGIGT